MTIALIDDAINLDYLQHPKQVACFAVKDGHIVRQTSTIRTTRITHATRCAQVLEALQVNCPIIHIRIMPVGCVAAQIEDLVLALQYCLIAGVDIICLSVGSTRLSDESLLSPIVKLLHRSGCLLFAALSNNGHVTLPASMPQAIGVVADEEHQMRPGCLGLLPENPWGANIAANYHTPAMRTIGPLCGNSFAVPFAVGMAYHALAQKGSKDRAAYAAWTDMLPSLPAGALRVIPARQPTVPVSPPLNIALRLGRPLKPAEMQRLADLLRQHGIESAFVSELHSEDSRIFHHDTVPLCAATSRTSRLCADVDVVFFDLPLSEYYSALHGLPIEGVLSTQERHIVLTTSLITICKAGDHSMWDIIVQAVSFLFEEESAFVCASALTPHTG